MMRSSYRAGSSMLALASPPASPPRPALIRLCQTGGWRGRYTALSHRWGAKHPLTTITANLEEHQRRIPLEKLP